MYLEYLESSMTLGFIAEATSYEELTEKQVSNFLNQRAEKSKEVIRLEKLDKIVSREIRTNMFNTSAVARALRKVVAWRPTCR